MKSFLWFIVALVLLVGGYWALSTYVPLDRNTVTEQNTETMPPQVIPISHATGILQWNETTAYFDPTGGAAAFAGRSAPDLILLTDIHGDHLSTSTIAAIKGAATIVAPQAVAELLPEDLKTNIVVLANGDTTNQAGIQIEAVPMYNLPDAENAGRHPKGRGNGYVLEKDGFRVYIAGDTAGTPEMRAMRDIDIALVPMNLPYTMGVDEAADAVLEFKPKQVYPYHYATPDGLSNVERFRQLVNAGDPNIEVILGAWYPES